MRIQFARPQGASGLPLIPVVPDFRLSTIEGRNGIGKTLAARVLELLTGGQPFAALPKAWESLCSDLGQVTVTVDGFPDGSVLRCELDSARWKERSEAECAQDPGVAYINDKRAEWHQVRRLLQVRRIAGDEGLAETLGRTLRESGVVARTRDRQASEWVAKLGIQLGVLTDELVNVRHETIARLQNEFMVASNEQTDAAAAADQAQGVFETSREILAWHEDIGRRLTALPAELEAHRIADDVYKRAEARAKAADERLTDLGRQQVIGKTNQERAAWLRERLPHRMRALAEATFYEQQTLARLGLDARPRPAEVRKRVQAIDKQIEILEQENRAGYLAGTVRRAQESIQSELRSMPSEAQDQHIATIGREIRVQELAAGIARRHRELLDVPKPDEVEERERAISDLQIARARLQLLADLFRKTDQKQKLVDEANAELERLSESGQPDEAKAEAKRESDSARLALLAATVALRKAQSMVEASIGLMDHAEPSASSEPEGHTQLVEQAADDEEIDEVDEGPAPLAVDELEGSVREWLRSLESEIDVRGRSAWKAAVRPRGDLTVALLRAADVARQRVEVLASETEVARQAFVAASEALASAQRRYARVYESVAIKLDQLWTAIRALADDAGPWANHREALEQLLSKVSLSWHMFADMVQAGPQPEELLSQASGEPRPLLGARVVETIAMVASDIEESAARVRDAWSIASSYLHRASAELSPRFDAEPFDVAGMRAESTQVLNEWAERSLSELLSAPELRAELFDAADDVTFNVSDSTVSWTDRRGSRKRRRPVEAFSSGEQVFAYTRAKLERLRHLRDETQFVVVFLDEFGAFVARDRFAQLIRYIEHDALGAIADQIVVTVPLSGDLETVAENAASGLVRPLTFPEDGYVVVPSLSG